MRRGVSRPGLGFLMVVAAAMVLLPTSPAATPQPTEGTQTTVPAFIRADRCYRLTFPIAGSPNWKVLEVLDNGWIKAEVHAGPASERREPTWINTAQIITALDAKCSA